MGTKQAIANHQGGTGIGARIGVRRDEVDRGAMGEGQCESEAEGSRRPCGGSSPMGLWLGRERIYSRREKLNDA